MVKALVFSPEPRLRSHVRHKLIPSWTFLLEMLRAPGRLKRPNPVAQKHGVLLSTHLSRSKNFRTRPWVGASQAGRLLDLWHTKRGPRLKLEGSSFQEPTGKCSIRSKITLCCSILPIAVTESPWNPRCRNMAAILLIASRRGALLACHSSAAALAEPALLCKLGWSATPAESPIPSTIV